MATSLLSYFCCCYYSMGCEGDKKECACVASAVLFVISLGSYFIMVAFGWLFFATAPQENQLVYAAAITSSIPAYVVALILFLHMRIWSKMVSHEKCAEVSTQSGAPEPVPQVPRPRDQCWKQNL